RLGREVLVNDADDAFLRDGDREARLGHGVHCGGHERDIELELAAQACLQRSVARQDARVGGQEEDIVEGQRLLDHPHGIAFSQSSIIRERSFARERRRENQRQCHPLQGRSVDTKMNRLVVMLLAIAFAGTASAQLYKWVDNNGRVQYGDTPPGDASKVTRLRPAPAGSAPAPAAPAATSETAAKDKDKDKALTPEQAFKKRQQERQEAEQKAEKERA